ncbi:uncharacterized protein K452DRAFT_239214, partial [Aplosporella prunicola CBS 121167]
HLLIPATSSGLYLCRLLLSAAILNYPTPVLINWEGKGEFDASISHLAKVRGLAKHLDSFPPERDQDLVLIIDGFDVWLQLRPEVMIQRYYATIHEHKERLEARFGREAIEKHNFKDTLIFGSDKTCWPPDWWRPACWAVPESTIPLNALGPKTDVAIDGHTFMHVRPRWLNSGTVIGPVKDMRRMMNATLDFISKTYKEDHGAKNSDQMYMADLWGIQEYARSLKDLDDSALSRGPLDRRIPELPAGQETEYHISVDYESKMFQTNAGMKDFTAWMKHDLDDWSAPGEQQVAFQPYNVRLQADVANSRGPFAAGKMGKAEDNRLPVNMSWKDVPLGFNSITDQIFPLLHMTGNKAYIDLWWNRLWFHPHSEELLKASKAMPKGPVVKTEDGRSWLMAEEPGAKMALEKASNGEDGKGGVWSDQGQWLAWNKLCSAVDQDQLFLKEASG